MLGYEEVERGRVEFRVPGTLEVAVAGQSIDLGPLEQRSLLALLLINANRVVATDRILEEIWGDDAAGKENALRGVHIATAQRPRTGPARAG